MKRLLIGMCLMMTFIFCINNNALAISDDEYKQLRSWTLGSSGLPSAKWGVVDCKVWSGIYPDCKHAGVDYGSSGKKVDIKSVCAGKVVSTGGTLGKVCIYNSTTKTTFIYLHLSSIDVKVGKTVTKGQVIGKTGSTGATAIHLHFEARSGEKTSAAAKYSDTIDPYASAKKAR